MKIPMYFDYKQTNMSKEKMNGIPLKEKEHFYTSEDNAHTSLPYNSFADIEGVNQSYYGKYFYPFYISWQIFNSQGGKFLDPSFKAISIPTQVIKDLKENRAKILLTNIFEGCGWEMLQPVLKKIQKRYKLSYKDFVLLTGNTSKSIGGIQNIYYNTWQQDMVNHYENSYSDLLGKAVLGIWNNELKEHKFLCLQRRPKTQRLVTYTELYKFRDQGILTMGNGDGDQDQISNNIYDEQIKVHYPKSYKRFKKLLHTIPREYDVSLSWENPVNDDNIEKYLNSYLHIVSETYFEKHDERLFYSEKAFKPIVFLQPFVHFAQPGSLQELRNRGYETFSDILDESYDNIENDQERLYAVLNTIKKYIQKDKNEMHVISQRIFPKLIHNYNNLKVDNQHMYDNCINELRNILSKM